METLDVLCALHGIAMGAMGDPTGAVCVLELALNVYYSPDYVVSTHSFETTRKARWIADSIEASSIEEIGLVRPQALTLDQVLRVHDHEYVRAVQTGEPLYLAESQGLTWDPGLWPMVLASNGGAVAAALDALEHGLSGSLSSGLHHARRRGGAGFCTFNGLAIAAREAIAAGAGSVLIVDLDAHCGGGTASLIADDPRIWQMDVAMDSFDFYGSSVVEQSERRIRLRLVRDSEDYLAQIQGALREIEHEGPSFGLCLYNAGMDPFEGCSIGGLTGISREILAARERLVFDWFGRLGAAVAFVMAGGYLGPSLDTDGLVDLHRLTLSAAAKSGWARTSALPQPPS
jgi:acetoin utilization deacetylase AcuC-like enzyme